MGLILNGMQANKKINSTSTNFNFDSGLKFENVVLKAGTDIVDPVFIVQKKSATAIPKSFNYLYCADFDRYYWIRTIVQSSGGTGGSAAFMELHCHVDVLGSWKTVIGDTPCFVKYCSDKTWSKSGETVVDLKQDDDRLSADLPLEGKYKDLLEMKDNKGVNLNTHFTDPLNYNDNDPSFVLTLGQMGPGATSTGILVLDKGQYSAFWSLLWTKTEFESFVTSADKFFEWMSKKLGGVMLEPTHFIQDIRLVPFKYSNSFPSGILSSLNNIGKLELGKIDGKEGKWYTKHDEYICAIGAIEIPIPGLGAAGDDCIPFLRRKKYTKLTLTSPFGDIDISTDNLVYADKVELTVKAIIETTSGDMAFHVLEKNTGELLGKITGNVSYSLTHMLSPGGYKQNEVAGALKGISSLASLGGGVIGGLIGGPVGAGVGGAIGHTVGSVGNTAAGMAQTSTSNGGSIVATSSSWIDYMIQTLKPSAAVTPGQYDLEQEFTLAVKVNTFIPRVCNSKTEYENYAKIFGYPCQKYVDKFSDITVDNTFIQCANFDINLGKTSGNPHMYPQEANEINAFLNSGIYWEVSQSKKEADQKDQPPEINPSR